ncbi:MAG TPA: glycosyltransferase family 39 protein [Candidatus Krumholzibacteria bacterium]|nr:glycosyltransferase family 39 protein [Candidatus Krumholzibacteria bacterium]
MTVHEETYDAQGRPRSKLLPDDNVTLALALTTLLALLLRLFRLGHQSLWVDELMTIRQGAVPGTTLWQQFLHDTQNPLPMVIVTLLGSVSEHEAWLRMPGALLGALSIPIFFEVVRRIADARTALLAAMLLAIHPMHIDHSQEVRGYAFLVFFGLAATWIVLDAGTRLSWARMPWLVLTGVAAGLSNLQGLFWMAGLALGIVVSGRYPVRTWGRWAIPFVLILVVLTPWWSLSLGVHETGRLLPEAETGEPLRGESTFTPWAFPYAGLVLSMGSSLGPSDDELHEEVTTGGGLSLDADDLAIVGIAALLVVALACLGLRALGRRSWELLAWASVAIVMAGLLAARNVKPFNPRYVITALPVLLVFVAAGLNRLPVRWGLVLLLVWIGLTGVSLQRMWFDPEHVHEDVRGAARLIANREGPDDAILVPTVRHVFDFYYRGESPRSGMQFRRAMPPDEVDEALERVGEGRRFLWYVKSRPWFGDPERRIDESLRRRHEQISRFEMPGVEVYLFDRSAEPTAPEESSAEGESGNAVPDSVRVD